LSVAGQVVEELCERFPSAKTNTLARKAFKENPGLYNSIEHARDFIRKRRGESGDAQRRQCILTPTTKHVRLPKSDALPKRDYRFFENGFGAILSDIHIPYHSERALEIAIGHCRAEGATDFVILNGDTVDCYQLSRWVRDPRKRNFRGEIDKTNQLLDYLQSIFGKIIFKLGNHEVRFYDYLRSQAPVLLDIEALTWEDLLKFKERGIDIVADGQAIVTPNLHIVHGHEWGGDDDESGKPCKRSLHACESEHRLWSLSPNVGSHRRDARRETDFDLFARLPLRSEARIQADGG
jgi:predicted phosphodiesterase